MTASGRRVVSIRIRSTAFLADQVLRTGRWRMTPTRANTQPAFVVHRHLGDERYEPYGVHVLTIVGTGIARITAFNDSSLVPTFTPAGARWSRAGAAPGR